MRVRWRRSWRIAVPMIAMAAAIGSVEAGLRLRELGSDARFFVAERERGWALRPGYAGWSTEENKVWVRINSAGYRDRERSIPKPPSMVRVAVLGDSFMQAMNVPLEKMFTSYLEAALGRCAGGRQVEVLNFGVSGYGTAQQLITYRRDVARYSPDIVMLAFYTDNDVHDNHPSTDDRVRSYFVLRDGRLVALARGEILASLPLHHRFRLFLTDHLRAADAAYAAWARLRAWASAASGGDETGGGIYAPPQGRDLIEAWQVTEALLLEMRREVSRRGSAFWLVTLANAAQVTPAIADRAGRARAIGTDSRFYPDHRLAAFAARHGIPVVTLVEPLAEFAARTGRYLHGGYQPSHPFGSGHWNETANALAADVVAARVCGTL